MLTDYDTPTICTYFYNVKQQHYKALLYFITITIVITIGIQVYWNVQNYNTNKQRLINEVQISLDNAVESYYADFAKTDFFSFIDLQEHSDSTNVSLQMIGFSDMATNPKTRVKLDSTINHKHDDYLTHASKLIDCTSGFTFTERRINGVSIVNRKSSPDSLTSISGLLNKLTISIKRDSLDFKRLDTLLLQELDRKKIRIDYGLLHLKADSLFKSFKIKDLKENSLSTFSKSTYLPINQKLQLQYSNPTMSILKRSLTGILLSLLLATCIIACLFYLLHIINKQKELAEIKNDLISNITHEFKTPIATVSTAIEGIKNFNKANDKEKTDNYLNISEQQLKKLHLMVEKLLETATLDSDKLIINTEEIDLVLVLKNLVEKYQMLSPGKTISFKSNSNTLTAKVDPFHFENALANLIDNAIKYGGETIEVNLNSLLNSIEITVADDGGKIDKNQREKIFDKFYRVPTGNRHDVKGFGIGLFYSKKIIEKHNGTLSLVPDTTNTIFKIVL